MTAAGADDLGQMAAQLSTLVLDRLRMKLEMLDILFFKVDSSFSVYSLLSALLIAVVWIVARRRTRGRRIKLGLIVRALFPRSLLRSASTWVDIGFMFMNVFAIGVLVGWAVLSGDTISHWVEDALIAAFGARPASSLDPWLIRTGLAVGGLLAYEFGYWLDHYLSHTVPFLWQFHRVHHTAERLTPLTVFRVHPVDTVVFANILALVAGSVNGIEGYMLGDLTQVLNSRGGGLILLAFIFVTVHLQHSHVWIAFTGGWGRIFASPAHHQIHHSADPAHFGKNLGSCLVLWDWLFGTLRVPAPTREALVYGVEPGETGQQTIAGTLATPFARAIASLVPRDRGLGAALARNAVEIWRRGASLLSRASIL